MRTVEVLGVPVSAGRFDEALAFLAERVARREPTVISCANAWSLVLALDDPEHRARLARADLLLADGMPVVWIARLRGVGASRVHADDLMLAACAAFPRWGHFLLGGATGQSERVADALRRRLPGIEIAGHRATPVRPVPGEESESIVEAIRRSGAGMVWVGMGTPAQDIWMDAFARRVGVPMAGVGSAFDLLSARTRPVPEWAKRSGLQWLFRLAQEPRRLGPRYLATNPRFLWHAARELLAR